MPIYANPPAALVVVKTLRSDYEKGSLNLEIGHKQIEATWSLHSCDICQSLDSESLGNRIETVQTRQSMFMMRFEDVVCRNCGFVYAKNRPDDIFLENYYRSQYNNYESVVDLTIHYDLNARLESLLPILKKKSTVLEIGAANGEFLSKLKSFNFDVHGLDPLPGKEHAEYLQNIFFSKEKNRIFKEFDAIISYYVFEHISDLSSFISSVCINLKKGGLIYLEVPDFLKYPEASLNHEHLLHFRREHMDIFLENHGFQILPSHTFKPSRYFGFAAAGRLIDKGRLFSPINKIPKNFKSFVEEAKLAYKTASVKSERLNKFAKEQAIKIKKYLYENPGVLVYFWCANEYSTRIAKKLGGSRSSVFILDNSLQKQGTLHEGFLNPIQLPTDCFKNSQKKLFILCSPRWNSDIQEQISMSQMGEYICISGVEIGEKI